MIKQIEYNVVEQNSTPSKDLRFINTKTLELQFIQPAESFKVDLKYCYALSSEEFDWIKQHPTIVFYYNELFIQPERFVRCCKTVYNGCIYDSANKTFPQLNEILNRIKSDLVVAISN